MPPATSGAKNRATTVAGHHCTAGLSGWSGSLLRPAHLRRAETAGPRSTLRARRPVLVAVALFGLLIGFIVALVIGAAPGGHATAVEWTIQVLVLVGAVFLLAGPRARRS
jgi:hypothetical protein